MQEEKERAVVRLLRDAGCTQEAAEQCLRLQAAGEVQAVCRLLARQRMGLLESLHAQQKQLERLDFVIFMFRKKGLFDPEA